MLLISTNNLLYSYSFNFAGFRKNAYDPLCLQINNAWWKNSSVPLEISIPTSEKTTAR